MSAVPFAVLPPQPTADDSKSNSRNKPVSASASPSRRRFRALSPDSALALEYNHECACSECENQEFPEKLPDIPLSSDFLMVKDISDKSLLTELPKAFRIDASINASASAQLTKGHLENILKEISRQDAPESVVVVDLRQESHGYANGIPFSWYRCRNLINHGKTRSMTLMSESEVLELLQKNIDTGLMNSITLHEIRVKLLGSVYTSEESVLHSPIKIESEEEMCKSLGVRYIRFPVVDHHHPDEIIVESFMKFIMSNLNLSPDSKETTSSGATEETKTLKPWFHFHCKGGRGRSTSFMVMLDMFMYHQQKILSSAVSNTNNNTNMDCLKLPAEETFTGLKRIVEDFVSKQSSIGGSHLFKPPRCKNKQWKMTAFENRKNFLRTFYEYCSRVFNGQEFISYGDWIDENEATEVTTPPPAQPQANLSI